MSSYRLRLLDEYNQDLVELALHPYARRIPNAKLLFLPEQKVYSTRSYSAQLIGPKTQEIISFELQINGYSVDCSYKPHTGNIYFSDPLNNQQIFANSFGLSSVWLRIRTRQSSQILASDYFQVMVRPGAENYSVNAMGQFTARQYRTLLYHRQSELIFRQGVQSEQRPSLEEKVRYFYGLSKAMRRMLPELESIARARRSRTVRPQTSGLRDVHRPVEYGLAGRVAALRSASDHFSDLYSRPAPSEDVYENRIFVSFLYSVSHELGSLVQSVSALRAALPFGMETRGSYVSSSSYMSKATALTLEEIADDLRGLQGEFSQMYRRCADSLRARGALLHQMPAVSAAFAHIPVYQRLYGLMRQWFSLRPINAEDLHFVGTFLQITTLYEVYILCKLICFFEDWGFALTRSSRIHYEMEHDAFYKNTEINNLFVLEKDGLRVSIYYQPLIPDEIRGGKSECGLYRALSLSYPRSWSEPARGRYYTPDYVIRLDHVGWKGARYILADAKYATLQEVVDYKIIPLSYKYLFSLVPASRNDQISGLYIFHGKRLPGQEADSLLYSAYDLLDNPHARFPQVEILSFYEYAGTMQSEQFEALRMLLKLQIEQALGSSDTDEKS